MRPWADHLAAQGYAVSVPLLPGHGTRWQDLNKTTWADWFAEVERAFTALAARVDTVFVAGLSMGGALALRLATDRPDQLAGLVLVNPFVDTGRKDVKLLPVLKLVIPAFPGIADDIKKPGVEEYGYKKTPLRAAHSLFSALKALRADLGRVTCPVLVLRSTEDHVADPSSARAIQAAVGSTDVQEQMLENSYHVATLDNDAEQIFEASSAFFERVRATASGG